MSPYIKACSPVPRSGFSHHMELSLIVEKYGFDKFTSINLWQAKGA